MKPRVVLVYHDDGPADDRTATHLSDKGFSIDIRRPFRGDLCGEVTDDLAGTVIHGGMFDADSADRHPFLNEEYRWMGAVLDAGLPLLGLCQGAQMLAMHQGAWAGDPGHGVHEFGYHVVEPVAGAGDFLSGPLHVVQAHYHTFDLPRGARHLARSEPFENQAFSIGEKVFGLQFHAEQTAEGFARWHADSMSRGKTGAQDIPTMQRLGVEHDAAQDAWFRAFLDRLFGEPR